MDPENVMFINYMMILATIPAILISIIGGSFYSQAEPGDRRWFWIRVWLGAAVLLALPFALFSSWIFNNGAIIFLLLPVLIGILALLIVHWRSVRELYQADRWPIGALLLILAAQILLAVLLEPNLALLLLLSPLAIAGLWAAFGRIHVGWLAGLGWLLVVFLLLDAAGLVGGPFVYSQAHWRTAYKILSGLATLLAPLVAAGLLWRGLEARDKGEKARAWKYFTLIGLLALAIAAVTLRHAVLTRATSRGAEDHIPVGTLAAAVIGGVLFWFALSSQERRSQRLGIAFLVLAPAVVILSYSLGWRIDPLAITESRAQRLAAMIDQYKLDTGQYPSGLKALTPDYAAWIPGPLTGRGQVWCYQSGADYYRLGYALFQRYYDWGDGTPFYEPYYAIKVPAAAGQPPPGEWMCAAELDKLKEHGGL